MTRLRSISGDSIRAWAILARDGHLNPTCSWLQSRGDHTERVNRFRLRSFPHPLLREHPVRQILIEQKLHCGALLIGSSNREVVFSVGCK